MNTGLVLPGWRSRPTVLRCWGMPQAIGIRSLLTCWGTLCWGGGGILLSLSRAPIMDAAFPSRPPMSWDTPRLSARVRHVLWFGRCRYGTVLLFWWRAQTHRVSYSHLFRASRHGTALRQWLSVGSTLLLPLFKKMPYNFYTSRRQVFKPYIMKSQGAGVAQSV
jgi:hypothetical protein